MNHKINTTKEIVYVALDFTEGLADLVLTVRKPDGSILSPAPIVTEQGNGVYTASYTPDALGTWQEKIESVSNGDKFIRTATIVDFDIDTLKAQNDAISSAVTSVDGKVDTANTKLDSIETKVNNLGVEIRSGGYIA